MDNIIDSLSPLERKIIPFLELSISEIIEKSGLDKVSVLRALKFLENKNLIEIKQTSKIIIDLDVNGIHYKKNELPERILLNTLEQKNHLSLQDAKNLSKLSDNEFRVSLGVLKKKALIELKNGKISLTATKADLTKKFPEEQLLEKLPLAKSELKDLDSLAFENLKSRKQIIEQKEEKDISFTLTPKGKKIAGKQIKSNLIEEVTSKIIKEYDKSRIKKFRKYDIKTQVPEFHGGKKHFVNQSIEYAQHE